MFDLSALFLDYIPAYGFYALMGFALLSLLFSPKGRSNREDLTSQFQEQTKNLNSALAELRKTNEQLQKSKEEKSQLVNVLCHDLATALTGMNLLLKKIQKKYGDSPEVNRLMDLMSNTYSILGSVREARSAEAGKIDIQLEPVSFSSLTKTLENFYGEKLREKNLTLKITHAEPERLFFGNSIILANNVLGNLISNAIKYAPKDGEIRVFQENCDASGEVRLVVCDNGDGMPSSAIKRLNNGEFTSQCGTAGEKGNGLGLSIAKFYVNQLGGRLHIESRTPEKDLDNHGTTVSVYLKALTAEENQLSYLQ